MQLHTERLCWQAQECGSSVPVPKNKPKSRVGNWGVGETNLMASYSSFLGLAVCVVAVRSSRNCSLWYVSKSDFRTLCVFMCICKVNKISLEMGLDSVVSKHLEILDLALNLCPKQNFFPSSRSSILPKTATRMKPALHALIIIATLF